MKTKDKIFLDSAKNIALEQYKQGLKNSPIKKSAKIILEKISKKHRKAIIALAKR